MTAAVVFVKDAFPIDAFALKVNMVESLSLEFGVIQNNVTNGAELAGHGFFLNCLHDEKILSC